MSRLRSALCCVGLGAALAIASVWLAYFHPNAPISYLMSLPEIYAMGLTAVLFCLRARKSGKRERLFWQLWAAGCALWIAGIALGLPAWPQPLRSEADFVGMGFTFLPEVAMMVALVMQPERVDGRLRDSVGRYEAVLVALWWVYLFLLLVTPWRWIAPSTYSLWSSFTGLHYFQDFTLVLWLVLLAKGCHGRWRRVYAHMACAIAMITLTIGSLFQAVVERHRGEATVFNALIAVAFLWLALTSLFVEPARTDAYARRPEPVSGRANLLVSLAILAIPILMLWARFLSDAPQAVSRYRLLVSFAAIVAGVLLVYRWQVVADEHRENMVGELETSVVELRRLQGQFAEAEKLASLGQLAAGAAHEINNPVAAMLGYAELLHSDASASPRVREMGRKIGDQARRIRTLVQNLLSLGEHVNFEPQPVDVSTLVRIAVDLRRLDARHRHARPHVEIGPGPFEVRGDPEKLLQVFYRLLLDLSGEDGEKTVEVRARHEGQSDCVMVEFSEHAAASGALNICDAQQAQKGGGLSLSVCHAIIQEHHGSVARGNLPDGRRLFRVSLPSIQRDGAPTTAAVAAERA